MTFCAQKGALSGCGKLTLGKVRNEAHGQVKNITSLQPRRDQCYLRVEVEVDGKKPQDSGNALNVDPEGFVDILDNEWDGKREATDGKI